MIESGGFFAQIGGGCEAMMRDRSNITADFGAKHIIGKNRLASVKLVHYIVIFTLP
ncbi:hypothetical protein [Paenibacillus sp. MSJ-34]|uniref:hypothetical protein n=1 Tax=Paenibacillus sp. MSJ-34 TaxID=2841529 RepID=UPI001C114FB7|nr:hypothetical protein [Paenibacillus sp. MSJ-34]MBU5440777.1 hypothetical protein [Paenibacillus sp. MSJ-34]